MDFSILLYLAIGYFVGLTFAVVVTVRRSGKKKIDGRLYLDLLDDVSPIDIELNIGVGELSVRKTITLEVIDLNAGMTEEEDEV